MMNSNHLRIHAFACSDVGRVRDSNEDYFLVADLSEGMRIEKNGSLSFRSGPCGALFAVADGMGGAAGGEMASRTALRSLYREVQETMQEIRHPSEKLLEEILIDAVGFANRRVFDLGRSSAELAGMGTTLTMALEWMGHLLIGQIGDSRAYLLRQNGIRQVTRDQSLVAQKISLGELTEEEARHHPERNILLQALGVRPTVELALQRSAVRPGDVLLLCSDGLHSQLTQREIFEIVADSRSQEDAGLELIEQANAHGGPDNSTAVLVQFLVS